MELGPGPTPAEVVARLGGEADPREALLELAAGAVAKRAAADRARADVMAAVRVLFKAHVLSRRLADQPLDPTAWYRMTLHRTCDLLCCVGGQHTTPPPNTIRYRLGNTHAAGMRALGRARPEAGEADAPLVRELGHAMRFANAAYGFAAGIAIGSAVILTENR